MEHNKTTAATATTVTVTAATCSNLKNRGSSNNEKQSLSRGRGECHVGPAVHSQVIKIKQEIEKIKHPSLQQLEMRRVLVLRDVSRLRSRSPLGLAERAILVGNS